MPRKGKKSESQKQRRKLEASSGTSSGTNSVSGMNDPNPYVLSVAASHCQSDPRYSLNSRGRQCTCNSLMFLAVHNEHNELLTFNLDRILQKGDALYITVRKTLLRKKRFVSNFLNFDELPNTIKTDSDWYSILKHPQRFGFLKDLPAVGVYENLESTLQCLSADVTDALLLCKDSCIAVFRDRSGRFGFFDSHCRTTDGLFTDESTGTAVMLTFFHLEDMVERLLLMFQWCFQARDEQQFELLPVSFTKRTTASSVHSEVSLNCCELERDVQPSVYFENKALSNKEQCRSSDVSQQSVQVLDPVQQSSETTVIGATSTNEHLTYQDKMEVHQYSQSTIAKVRSEVSLDCCELERDVQPSVYFENKALSNKEQCRSSDVSQHYVQVLDPVQQSSETTVIEAASANEQAHLTYQDKMEVHQYSQSTIKQTEKLNKTRKQKAYYIKWRKEMVHRRGVFDKKQATRNVYDYKTSSECRKRHKQAMKNKYWNNMVYREQHKQAMKNNYKKINEYREKKKAYAIHMYINNEQYRRGKKSKITFNYINDEQFRQRQINYMIQNYRKDENFRQRHKNYVVLKYKKDENFRQRQKNYIITTYKNNSKFKEQHLQYHLDRYLKDPIFRQKQKDHYTNRCKNDPNFYEKRKNIFKELYHCDAHFMARQKQYYLFKSKNKISARKALHKIRCAQHIQHKYKKNDLMRQQRDTLQNIQPDVVQDPSVLRALNTFRNVITQGPTYVCTCCARALFSNQVKSCDRERYQKNPTVASVCLTGNYVHICSDCPDQCPLEHRKREWICHCCHTTLLRGIMPDIALVNKLQFTPIPPELCDLNVLERHVIAKYIPFAKIITLPKGQQRAIKGAVISVASEVETTVNCLPRPRTESQLLTVKLKRRLCYKGHYQFQTLNIQKVLSALRKLKEIHSEYKDIFINAALSEEEMFNEHEQYENDISAPDEEMDIENRSQSQSENTEEQSNENENNDDNTEDEQSRGLALDTCLQPPDLGQQLLSYDDGIFCIAPAERNSPVNTFKIPKLESMAFPVQFPDGKNTFDEPGREKYVSPSRYFNTRLFSIDNRCAKDTNYLFFAQFTTEVNLATSSMSIQLRKSKPMTPNELIRLESISEREPSDPNDVNEQENIPGYTASASVSNTAMPVMETAQLNPAQIRKMYQSLNQTQASIFYAVRDWCKRCVSGENPQQFLYFLNGGAGVGKSHVIKSIYAEATKILRRLPCIREHTDISKPTILLTAFTGTAAFNISGKTLHCLLKLPRNLKPPYQPLGNSLDEIRADLSNAHILIIDEISMVSKQLFAYVNWRLQQIKGNKKAFGGLSLLAVGDYYQLPPVGRAKPLCVYEDHVLDFWKDNFQMITLTQIMRQRNDLAYAELLNRLRVKKKHEKLNDADKCMLEAVIRSTPEECPSDALHIYATNKEVDNHNTEAISSRFSNIINIDAHDYKKDPRTGEMKRQAAPLKGDKCGLIDKLQIDIGARVMLTRNIDVEDGLVNGTFGKVAKITANTRDGSVQLIGLHLDNVTAGQKHRNKAPNGDDNIVYIERSEEPLKKKGTVRRQFPMKLAFACTIHKVQGMTTDCAVVSLKHIFEPGMAYVALSRTTSLSGLHITDFDEKKIFCDPEISASLENMPKAAFHNIQPILHIVQDSKLNSALKIIHHNTEGLECHMDDLKCHHELLLADVLCLTETHLSGSAVSENLHLDGYTMYKRNRHASYTNYGHLANKNGGGVAIYVRDGFQVCPLMYIQNVTDLEYLVLKIEAPKQALLAVIYRPPSYNLTEFLAQLNALLTSLEIIDFKPLIVCGDFNEDELSRCNKPILNLFEDKGYTQLISTGTTENNTLLDPVFISGTHSNVRAGVLQTYYSYHDPVYCVLE
ncbi:ATP-dependent DNA helicase PIF1 [Anabarilius grahami]|uniref:ATP-dependent DNA helicase n=1 Tax=Anabarilius grahami TaxID=495550 RepID=A0A3N0Z0H8_ANAGA|nr:ATP-dependent DNA helicase PIF1 [Anabarilius grahami]